MFQLLIGLLTTFLVHSPLAGTHCFDHVVNLASVESHIRPILVSRDEIHKIDAHCLEIKTTSIREKLFRKWIRQKFKYRKESRAQGFSLERSSIAPEKSHCRFLVTIMKKGSRADQSKSSVSSSSRYIARFSDPQKIKVGKDTLSVTCYKRARKSVEFSFRLKHVGKFLTSKRQVKKNENVILSRIVEKLKNNESKLSLKKKNIMNQAVVSLQLL